MTLDFSASSSAINLTIQDSDAYIDPDYLGDFITLPYGACTSTNCSSPFTVALNASAGHYYFNVSNYDSLNAGWAAIDYTLHGMNDPGELQSWGHS